MGLMSRFRSMRSRLVCLVASCAIAAGPARGGSAQAGGGAADASSFWLPWQGVVIGAVAGGAGGYLLARASCTGGSTIVGCDGLAVVGTVSLALLGGLIGGIIQGLFFWPEASPPPDKPLGAASLSLLPSVDASGRTSLSLSIRF
jgi:hypothetical protein